MNVNYEDGDLITFLINQINKYKYFVNVDDILQQSNFINKFVSVKNFNNILNIDNKKDYFSLSHHFIKISAYLFVINKIDKDDYGVLIWNNQKILVENFYNLKEIETDNYKALLTLLVYHHIINILENNDMYSTEYHNNLLKLNEVLVY